jgi:hypothetical protein
VVFDRSLFEWTGLFMPRARTTLPATLVAVLLLVGIVGAQPASAAPSKPRVVITLTAKPANPSGSSSAAFSWTTVATVTYTCALDGASSSCPGGTATYTGLADGPHSFSVRGKKPGTYRPGSAVYNWVVDTIPPAAPTISPIASPTSSTSASVSFTDNDPSATKFTCALDGASPSLCTSPFAVSSLGEGSHTVVVRSQDSNGVLGGSASVTWVVDLTAPANIQLIGPSAPYAATTNFTFSATGATAFTCSLDSAAATVCASPLHLAGLTDGTHNLVVNASDSAGNTAPASASWTVDTTAPQTPSIVTGPANPTNQTTADLVLGNPDGSSTLECRVDSVQPTDWVTCPSSLHWTGFIDGDHTIDVRAIDLAGNTNGTVQAAWTVDTLAPAPAQFSGGPNSPSSDTDPVFAFVNTDLSAIGFLCAFDPADPTDQLAYVDCDVDNLPPTFTPPLTDGQHALYVESVDASSNPSSPVPWIWTVDTGAPAAPAFTSVPATSTTDTGARFVFTSEPFSSLDCAVDGSATVACSSPFTLTGLALGAHSFSVTATDGAGNTSPAAPYDWTVTAPVPPVVTPPVPPVVTSPATAAPTTVTLTAARALLGRSTASFSADVRGLSTATVRLVSATGAVSPETLTCTNAGGAAVSCTSGAVRGVAVVPTKALTPGQQYTFSVQGTDSLGRTVAGSQAFRASTDEQEFSAAAVYGWAKVRSAKALGHSYLVESAKGATVTVAFTGRTVTWLTTTGPTQGRANVYVDGVRKAKVNNWSAATHWQVARTIKGLKAGTHRLKIVVAGRKGNTKGTGTDVVLDAVKVGKKLVRNAPAFTWQHVSATTASAGGYAVSAKKGATVSFTFRGTSVSWVSAKGPAMGKAKVYVDGVLKGTVDNFAKRSGSRLTRAYTGLADKVHTVTVVATGTKRKASKGTSVVVDRWLVG